MKEYPILFSTPMVRAILDGRKTMTRRVAMHKWGQRNQCEHTQADSNFICRHCDHGSGITHCPYGHTGDHLWVRETWATSKSLDHVKPSGLACGAPIEYAADRCLTISGGKLPDRGKWRPSIFMMPWMSRIKLEVTGVRVERLQGISEEDSGREGVGPCKHDSIHVNQWTCAFHDLWDSINEKRGYGWDLNPWVWVVEFRRVK